MASLLELSTHHFSTADVQQWTNYLWLGLVAFWLGTWLFIKRPVFRPSLETRLEHGIVVFLGLYLLFGRLSSIPSLGFPIFAVTVPVALSGMVIVAAGIGLAIWGRMILGSNWSAVAEIKEHHELIQTGPYQFMRHPIYEGFLIALCGSAIQKGSLCGALGVVVCFWGLQIKIEVEERLLVHRFGQKYLAYQRSVSALPPFLP